MAEIEDLMRDGKKHLDRGEYAESIAYFNKILKINPAHMSAIYYKGLAETFLQKDYRNDVASQTTKKVSISNKSENTFYLKLELTWLKLKLLGMKISYFIRYRKILS